MGRFQNFTRSAHNFEYSFVAGCRVQLDDRLSASTKVTVRRLSFWLNDADLFSGTWIPQSPNQRLKFISSELHNSNERNRLVYNYFTV